MLTFWWSLKNLWVFFEFIALEDYLSDLLGVKVDLVSKKALKPRIGERILKEVARI